MKAGELTIETEIDSSQDDINILSGLSFDLNSGSGLIDALSILIVKTGGKVINEEEDAP